MQTKLSLVLLAITIIANPLTSAAQDQTVSLDVYTNTVPMGSDYGGVATEMVEGTYQVAVSTDYALRSGDGACHKVVVFARTSGHPDSWVWVIGDGESQTLILEDDAHVDDLITVNCFLPEGSGTTSDNSGGATLTFTGPETYTVTLVGATDTITLKAAPGAWRDGVNKCESTCWSVATNYSLGPNMACNKVLLWIDTYGDPDGWVWVINGNVELCVSSMEYSHPSLNWTEVALLLPEGSANVVDNSGTATVSTSVQPGCQPVSVEAARWGTVKALYR